MIPYQAFNCPHCGAPGHVEYGKAEYSCECRFGLHYQRPQQQKWEQPYGDTWPLCATCGQPIYHGHVCSTAST